MAASSLDALQERIAEEANAAVREGLPAKAVELDQLLKELTERLDAQADCEKWVPTKQELAEFTRARAAAAAAEAGDAAAGAKKRKLHDADSGTVAAIERGEDLKAGVIPPEVKVNPEIVAAVRLMTVKITESIDLLGKVKTWVQLQIPRSK